MPRDLNRIELLTVVAIARLGEGAYGVAIADEIDACSGRRVSLAGVYGALERLVEYGFVRHWMSEPRPERGGRPRRCYDLTAAGRALVRRERESAMRMWRGVPLAPRAERQ